jgi:hypothetical protein
MKITIHNLAHHRNGIDGAPFDVFLFEDSDSQGRRKLGILFEEPHHCAVLDIAQLNEGDIAFGSNSWRGDTFEPHLRAALTKSRAAEEADHDTAQSRDADQEISISWSTEDVQSVRPDLSDDQAWQVLQAVEHDHDANIGVNWNVLECHAKWLFGDAPATGEAGEA